MLCRVSAGLPASLLPQTFWHSLHAEAVMEEKPTTCLRKARAISNDKISWTTKLRSGSTTVSVHRIRLPAMVYASNFPSLDYVSDGANAHAMRPGNAVQADPQRTTETLHLARSTCTACTSRRPSSGLRRPSRRHNARGGTSCESSWARVSTRRGTWRRLSRRCRI